MNAFSRIVSGVLAMLVILFSNMLCLSLVRYFLLLIEKLNLQISYLDIMNMCNCIVLRIKFSH